MPPRKKTDICISDHAHGRLAPSDKGSQNKVNKRKPKRNFSVFWVLEIGTYNVLARNLNVMDFSSLK